jgi:hypothetical protein
VKATLKEAEKGHLFEVVVEPTLKDMKTVFQSEDLEAKLEVDGKPIPFLVQVAIKLKDRIDVEPSQSVYFRRAETAKAGGEGAAKLVKTLEIVSIGGSGHTFRVTGATVQNKVFSAACRDRRARQTLSAVGNSPEDARERRALPERPHRGQHG